MSVALYFYASHHNFNSDPNTEYMVSDSTFVLGSSWWDLEGKTKDSVRFSNGLNMVVHYSITLVITQYNDSSKFESKYKVLSNSSGNYIFLNNENLSIAGIEVKYINATDSENKTSQYYYFQKNGKYYSLYFSGFYDDINKYYDNAIKFTAESVISTIK